MLPVGSTRAPLPLPVGAGPHFIVVGSQIDDALEQSKSTTHAPPSATVPTSAVLHAAGTVPPVPFQKSVHVPNVRPARQAAASPALYVILPAVISDSTFAGISDAAASDWHCADDAPNSSANVTPVVVGKLDMQVNASSQYFMSMPA